MRQRRKLHTQKRNYFWGERNFLLMETLRAKWIYLQILNSSNLFNDPGIINLRNPCRFFVWLIQRRCGFNSWALRVEFVKDEVVLGQASFFIYFRLPLPVVTPLVFHIHSSTFTPKSSDSRVQSISMIPYQEGDPVITRARSCEDCVFLNCSTSSKIICFYRNTDNKVISRIFSFINLRTMSYAHMKQWRLTVIW